MSPLIGGLCVVLALTPVGGGLLFFHLLLLFFHLLGRVLQ